jgi:membrane associated rhomboid family serine protease
VQVLLRPFLIALLLALLPVLAFVFIQNHNEFTFVFGLIPGDTHHLQGIVLMPLAHGDANHLWGNTLQLFLCLFLIFIHFRHLSKYILFFIWVGSGTLLWFMGKHGSLHIGSSGVIYGLFGFLISAGIMAGNRRLRLLSFMLLMYYGSMIWGVFPWQEKISWEGHLAGLTSGVITAFILRNSYRVFTGDIKPSWFNDSDSREDPYAGFDKSR